MLDRVSFKNFKSLREVTLDLGRLTVLVGPNGSGKSSVLQGLHLLSRTSPKRRFDETFGGLLAPARLASAKAPTTLELSAHEAEGDTLSLVIEVPASDDEDTTPRFRATIRGTQESPKIPRDLWKHDLDKPSLRRFSSVAWLHLDPSALARTSIAEEEEPRLTSYGHGLASTLAWLTGAKPDVVQQIATSLGQVVPGVRRILVHRERINDTTMDKVTIDGQPVWRPVERTRLGDRFSIEFDDGREVPADLLSEGTVLALGLLTKLHEPERPRVLLLDDIDRGLHIGAQAKLVSVLRELMKRAPELQVVCTTHSAYLLDLFEPSEVRVLDLDERRSTHVLPLTAHPDFDKWRFGTQTGELWAALGEAWVTQRPRDAAS